MEWERKVDQVMGTFVCCVEAFGYRGGVKGVKEMRFKVAKGCSSRGLWF